MNFFFVLSGFLITYLLIKEKEFTGRIHVPNFYVRRVLRIWPLYYLCVIIGFIGFGLLKKYTGEPVMENANPWYYVFFAANFDLRSVVIMIFQCIPHKVLKQLQNLRFICLDHRQ